MYKDAQCIYYYLNDVAFLKVQFFSFAKAWRIYAYNGNQGLNSKQKYEKIYYFFHNFAVIGTLTEEMLFVDKRKMKEEMKKARTEWKEKEEERKLKKKRERSEKYGIILEKHLLTLILYKKIAFYTKRRSFLTLTPHQFAFNISVGNTNSR